MKTGVTVFFVVRCDFFQIFSFFSKMDFKIIGYNGVYINDLFQSFAVSRLVHWAQRLSHEQLDQKAESKECFLRDRVGSSPTCSGWCAQLMNTSSQISPPFVPHNFKIHQGEEGEDLKKVASHDKKYGDSPVFIRIQPPSTNLPKTEITGKCSF